MRTYDRINRRSSVGKLSNEVAGDLEHEGEVWEG